jgi:hypothetical protein
MDSAGAAGGTCVSAIKRRARDKDGNAIEPMTLGNMREHGIERVEVSCARPDCGYAKSVTVSEWPDDFPVPDVGARIPCPRCGAPELDSRPDWTGFKAAGRG